MSTNFLHLIPRSGPSNKNARPGVRSNPCTRQGGQHESVSENELHKRGRWLVMAAHNGHPNAAASGFRVTVRSTLEAVEAKRQALRREWEAEIRQEFPSMRLCAGFRDREAALRELALQLLDVLNQAGPRGAA